MDIVIVQLELVLLVFHSTLNKCCPNFSHKEIVVVLGITQRSFRIFVQYFLSYMWLPVIFKDLWREAFPFNYFFNSLSRFLLQ